MRRESLVTAILVWCGLVVVSSLYITLPLISVIADTFNVAPAAAGWTGSAFAFAYAVGFLIFGPLSDRYGRKQVMFSGLVAMSLITPLLGLAANLISLVVLRALQGFAAATFAPSVLAYVVERYPFQKRVTTVGFISTGFLMAGIVGQLFSSLIGQSIGWPYVFYLLGGLYILSTVLLGSFVPMGEKPRTRATLWSSFRQMRIVLLQRRLFISYLITVTLLLSFVGMYTALGQYLSQTPYELTGNQILMVRATGIAGMILSPLAGRFVSRFGIQKVLQAGLALAAAGLAALGTSSNLTILVVMSVLFVAGISITVPTLISMIGTLAGEARGAAVSLYMFILFIGATLAPIIVLNLLKTESCIFTFETLAAVLALSLFVSFFIRSAPTVKREVTQ